MADENKTAPAPTEAGAYEATLVRGDTYTLLGSPSLRWTAKGESKTVSPEQKAHLEGQTESVRTGGDDDEPEFSDFAKFEFKAVSGGARARTR